jgi:hypothetical protein
VHVKARIRGQPVTDLDTLVGRVVVHHEVEFLIGVGLGDVLEERQKLLVAVPRLEGGGDVAGGDVDRGEQGRGPAP